ERLTAEHVNFMATHGRGLVCLSLTESRCDQLGLPMMVSENRAPLGTAFTVSIDARHAIGRGISAVDRAATIRTAIRPDATPADIVSPGHVFPLRARRGGVLVRAGQTEGAVDLARLAGFAPAGVICEILRDDGTMARLPDLEEFAARHNVKIATIADLIEYRSRHDSLVHRTAEARITTRHGGDFRALVYTTDVDEGEHLVLAKGEIRVDEPTLVRTHLEYLPGDVFGYRERDTRSLLQKAMERIAAEGKGVILYLRRDARGPRAQLRGGARAEAVQGPLRSGAMRRAGAVAVLVGLSVAVSAAPPPEDVVRAKLTAGGGQAVVEATITPGWHVNAHQPRDEFLIPTTVTLTPPAGVRAGEVKYPPPVEKRLGFSGGTTLLLYDGTVRFTATLEGTPAAGGGPLRAALRFQACDDSRCLPPRTLDLVAALDAPAPPGAAEPPAAGQNQVAGWIARWGWPLTFLWVALVGVALNLTPCVYPLISVTVAFFGGRTGAGEAHMVRRALLYVLGICLTFSTLGVTAALTGSLFGSALQRPAVLAAIALALVGLAGSNFGF